MWRKSFHDKLSMRYAVLSIQPFGKFPWPMWILAISRRNGIRMVVCRCGGICIQKDIFCFFDILRIRGLYISPLSQKIKIKNPLRGAAVSLSKLSFDYFHYEKNRCCITVQLPVIILIVHLNNTMYKQFVQTDDTYCQTVHHFWEFQ